MVSILLFGSSFLKNSCLRMRRKTILLQAGMLVGFFVCVCVFFFIVDKGLYIFKEN